MNQNNELESEWKNEARVAWRLLMSGHSQGEWMPEPASYIAGYLAAKQLSQIEITELNRRLDWTSYKPEKLALEKENQQLREEIESLKNFCTIERQRINKQVEALGSTLAEKEAETAGLKLNIQAVSKMSLERDTEIGRLKKENEAIKDNLLMADKFWESEVVNFAKEVLGEKNIDEEDISQAKRREL